MPSPMIETSTRSRKDPLKPIKMEDIKIEFVDLCVLPSEGMNVVEFDSSEAGSPAAAMEITIPSSGSSEPVRPRKRAKLDHLSPEEKAQHRKMMNRISAQSARDRQKALMIQQEATIKTLQATVSASETETLKKQNAVLNAKNTTLSTENDTLKQENQRLSTLVMELEAKLKAASQTQNPIVNSTSFQEPSVDPSQLNIKLEDKNESKQCCGSSLEPAVLRTVPLQKGPPEPLQNLPLILLLWTMYLGIWTHQKSCESSESSQKRFSAESNSCQNSNSLAQLQKLLLHKWSLRPRPGGLEQKTPG